MQTHSGIARNKSLLRQSLYIDLIERVSSHSTDSQILSSMGGTLQHLQVDSSWMEETVFLHVISNAPA